MDSIRGYLYPQDVRAQARCHLPVAVATTATLLKDALTMVAASHNLRLFSEDGEDLDLLLSKLRELDVETCEDFRLAFVMDDEVDKDALMSFGTGAMFPYRELLLKFADEVITDGAFTLSQPHASEVKKRSCPSHIVCGRLVYRKLEDYKSTPVPKSNPSLVAFQPPRLHFQVSCCCCQVCSKDGGGYCKENFR